MGDRGVAEIRFIFGATFWLINPNKYMARIETFVSHGRTVVRMGAIVSSSRKTSCTTSVSVQTVGWAIRGAEYYINDIQLMLAYDCNSNLILISARIHVRRIVPIICRLWACPNRVNVADERRRPGEPGEHWLFLFLLSSMFQRSILTFMLIRPIHSLKC